MQQRGTASPGDPAAGAMRRLLGSGRWDTVARAAQLSAGLLVLPVVTRVLGPADYGTVAAALIAVQVLTYLAAAGIPAAVTRIYFEGEAGPERARGLILVAAVTALAVVAVADLTGNGWSRIFSDVPYRGTLRAATWASLPFAFLMAPQFYLRAAQRTVAFAALALASSAGAQLLGLFAITVLDGGPTGYVAGLAAGYTVAAAWGVALTRPWQARPSLLAAALRYGLPTVPHGLALFILSAGDRVVIERVDGIAEVGRYQVAYIVGALGLSFAGALYNAWTPLILGESEARRRAVLAATTRHLLGIGAIVTAGLAIGGPVALRIAAPGSFDPGTLTAVTAVVALSLLPYLWYLAAALVVFQEKRTGVLAWATPLVAALNVALNVWLVPVFGLTGAAATTAASYAVLAVLVLAAARRMTPVAWHPAPGPAIVAAAGVLAGALVPADGWWLVVRAVLGAGLAGALVVVVRDRFRG
jgi:O-antigen/teichoic acid export membrane protein